ncbi:MAG: helix-turn-helix transcriptional regulator [Eubacteriales bacterium]|nr:helix-turn-helix transcriptional regulator [Eubacteriales bacterium]
MEFNIYLKKLRQDRSLTQAQISEILGIDQSTYAHYESGRRTPDIDKLRRLAAYYGLVDELLDINRTEPVLNNMPLYGKYYKFKRLFDSPVELERVYPTKQETAVKLFNVLHPDERVVSAMLFGSSITMKCTSKSDTDIAVRLCPEYTNRDTKNEISERVLEVCEWHADILWFDSLDPKEKIYKDICKGVQIA